MLEATKTLFPHKYMAGEAIKLALNALGLNLEPGSYMVDVVASQLDADRILRMIRKQSKRRQQQAFNKITVRINTQSIHWYLGVLKKSGGTSYPCRFLTTALVY